MKKKPTPKIQDALYITYTLNGCELKIERKKIAEDELGTGYYYECAQDGTKLAYACRTKDLNGVRQFMGFEFHLWTTAPIDQATAAFRTIVTNRLLKEAIHFNKVCDAKEFPATLSSEGEPLTTVGYVLSDDENYLGRLDRYI